MQLTELDTWGVLTLCSAQLELETVLGGNNISLCLSGEHSAHQGLVEEAGQLGALALPGMEQQEVPCQLQPWALPLCAHFSVPPSALASLGQANKAAKLRPLCESQMQNVTSLKQQNPFP